MRQHSFQIHLKRNLMGNLELMELELELVLKLMKKLEEMGYMMGQLILEPRCSFLLHLKRIHWRMLLLIKHLEDSFLVHQRNIHLGMEMQLEL